MPTKSVMACSMCHIAVDLPLTEYSDAILFQHPDFDVVGERLFCSALCFKRFRAWSAPAILYPGETQEQLRKELGEQ